MFSRNASKQAIRAIYESHHKFNAYGMGVPTQRVSTIAGQFGIKNGRYFSTAPPPPPPPPSLKDTKGLRVFNRISRAVTFSLSTVVVIGATGLSLLVIYLIFSELFLPSGDTRTFNKAVKMVEENEAAQAALGFKKGERLKAHGEVYGDKWVRNRPAQSVRTKGQDGKDHLLMRFQVESSSGKYGRVILEQIDESIWSADFAYVALDIPHHNRIYIKEPHFQPKDYIPSPGFMGSNKNGFLGLKWGPKKDD